MIQILNVLGQIVWQGERREDIPPELKLCDYYVISTPIAPSSEDVKPVNPQSPSGSKTRDLG